MTARLRVSIAIVSTAVLLWFVASATAQKNTPRLSGAILLTGYPPDNLMISAGGKISRLQANGGDWYITPSMSADGQFIASAHIADLASATPRARPKLIVGVYSLHDKQWRDYANLEILGGSVAISPDGSRLACSGQSADGLPPQLRFLDLKTGTVTIGPGSANNAGEITWSPDGRRIAFDKEVERSVNGESIPPHRAIFVLDVETGTASKIADGMSPSWSPSGEWIAFYDYQPGRDDVKKGWYADNANRVSVIHPDGTDYRTLATFRRDESLSVPSVWSPGSQTLLINRWRDEDKGTMDIYLLELAKPKLTPEFKNTQPVFSWIAAKDR